MKLIIHNSMSRVEGLTGDQLKALRKVCSYSIDPKSAYFSGSAYNTTRYLMDKKGNFPTGILARVQKHLKGHQEIDLRVRPEPLPRLFDLSMLHTPYPEQLEAAKACQTANRGIVSAVTGSGKTLIAALIVNLLQVPTLIVVPSLELKRQTTEAMQAYFGKHRVGELGTALAIENVDALDPKRPLNGYGAVIIDEYHHSAAKTYRQLNQKAWKEVYYRFGLTATPFRTQDHEKILLESILAEVVYKLSYQTAAKKGYIVPVDAFYVEMPKVETDACIWPEVYSELVVNNKPRNELIAKIMQSLWHSGVSALCLVKEIAHGEAIKALIPGNYTKFATGKNDDSAKLIADFNRASGGSLIGTEGILGEGVDTRPAEYIIIAGLGKSRTQLMQKIGRGLRRYPGKDSCKILLIKDTSHKYLLTHFKEQVKVVREEYGIIPAKLEVV